jgi:hypothetical protein
MKSSCETFVAGVVTGIVLSVVGVAGVLKIIDKGVEFVKTKAVEINTEITQK